MRSSLLLERSRTHDRKCGSVVVTTICPTVYIGASVARTIARTQNASVTRIDVYSLSRPSDPPLVLDALRNSAGIDAPSGRAGCGLEVEVVWKRSGASAVSISRAVRAERAIDACEMTRDCTARHNIPLTP